MDAYTADTPLCEAAHLVVHQGEQGIDDDGKPFNHQRGKHEADRFPASGRQGDDHPFVVAFISVHFQNTLDDQLLVRPKGRDAKTLFG